MLRSNFQEASISTRIINWRGQCQRRDANPQIDRAEVHINGPQIQACTIEQGLNNWVKWGRLLAPSYIQGPRASLVIRIRPSFGHHISLYLRQLCRMMFEKHLRIDQHELCLELHTRPLNAQSIGASGSGCNVDLQSELSANTEPQTHMTKSRPEPLKQLDKWNVFSQQQSSIKAALLPAKLAPFPQHWTHVQDSLFIRGLLSPTTPKNPTSNPAGESANIRLADQPTTWIPHLGHGLLLLTSGPSPRQNLDRKSSHEVCPSSRLLPTSPRREDKLNARISALPVRRASIFGAVMKPKTVATIAKAGDDTALAKCSWAGVNQALDSRKGNTHSVLRLAGFSAAQKSFEESR